MRTIQAFKLAEMPAHSKELDAALTKHAENFLRAGGTLSLDDWSLMNDSEHGAFVAAGDRIRIEDSVNTGLAAQSLDSAASIYAAVDGGVLKVRSVIDQALANRVAKDAAKGS